MMHETPTSFDRIEVRTIGWDEVQYALAPGSLEPVTPAPGMMVAGIVQVDMDSFFLGMCSFDGLEQRNQAACVDFGQFQHLRLASLQIDRVMNVEGLVTSCLLDGDCNALRCPTSGGVDLMGGVHGIDEHDRFIRALCSEQLLVACNEGLLPCFIEVARGFARLTVVEAKPV
jgi:hypothetical protein